MIKLILNKLGHFYDSNWFLCFSLIAGQSFLLGCTANATKETPCQRSCGSRVIGGGPLVAIPLSGDLSLSCSGVLDQAFEFNFLVYEDNSKSTASSGDAGEDQSVSDRLEKSMPKRIPKGGVAYYPSIQGLVSLTGDDGNALPVTKNSETPSSDWCTDSCGYATMLVRPSCEGKQIMGVGIIVPGGSTGEVTGSDGVSTVPSIKVSVNQDD
jgi:hypothetical protein